MLGRTSARRQWLLSGLSLRARLILLVVVSLVPVVAFTLGRQYVTYEESVEATGERTMRAARRTAAGLEQMLRARIDVLEGLVRSYTGRPDDLDGFRSLADAAVAKHPGANIVLLRRDHTQVLNTLVPPGAPLPVRPPTTSTERVFTTGQPAVSDFYRAAIGGRPVIAIDVPVKRGEGQVELLLSLVPRMEDFTDSLRLEELPPSWIASVFDRQGVLVARSHDAQRLIGQPGAAALVAAMRAQPEGRIEYDSRDGIRMLASFVRMPGTDWTVVIGVPAADLVRPAIAAALRTLLVSVVLLALSVALAMFAASHIAGPIASLRSIAAATTKGSDAPVQTGLPETDEVARALRAAQRLRRMSEAAEEKAKTALSSSEAKLQQAQKMEAIGNLTGGMAHDFNNLLGVVVGNLEMAKPLVETNPELRELVDESLTAAMSGAELTRRLLAFARRQPLKPTHIKLNEVVGGMMRLLGRTLGGNIEIALELAPDTWTVLADPAQIEASLVNLATNARDAMPDGGRLTIRTGNRHLDTDYAASRPDVSAGDYAMIEVSDTGTGMPPDVMARIFEPFFTTKERGNGTGLGLAMVFGFMRQSGGHINVYSEPGKGTTFRLFLPRSATEPEVAPGAAEAIVGGSGEVVLVVEDNAALRRVAVRQLRELGYQVLEAENADAAMTVLERETVELMFSDVVMPGGIDGFTLARRVAKRWPKVKIVLTSGFSDTRSRTDPGVNVRVLSKPYRRADMARAMRDALQSS